jgi:hypothetical protein
VKWLALTEEMDGAKAGGERAPVVAPLSQSDAAALLVGPALNVLKPAEEARDIVAGIILEWIGPNRAPARCAGWMTARGTCTP